MTIPANQLVAVTPSVIAAAGTGLDLVGLCLTQSTRPPIGTVPSFPSAAAVSTYFGASSEEYAVALNYFGAFQGANKSPGAMLFAQYNSGAVAAYLRGGTSGLTLAQLQALSGTLTIVVDGYSRVGGTINLSTATSFSSAASIIQTALNTTPITGSSFTGSIAGATSGFTASIAGNIMTVTAVASGTLVPGTTVSGTGVSAGTLITSQISAVGPAGGVGVYAVSIAQVVASESMTGAYGVLTVTGTPTGAVAIGQTLSGTNVTANTLIWGLGTGTGGAGTYYVSPSGTTASTTITGSSTSLAVSYDSIAGAFVITSGIIGPSSTVAFPTGTLAAGIFVTSATGAVLSQGAAAAQPGAFMTGVIAVTMNWATFFSDFDPDGGGGTAVGQKLAFATWTAQQNNRFGYVAWDNDAVPPATLPASSSFGQLVEAAEDSGVMAVWTPDTTTGPATAAFVCGSVAAIDFTQTNGRTTLAYRQQAGLVAGVTSGTAAQNLLANFYNFYGAYAAANQGFIWFQNGQCAGAYEWFDSFVNQIWLNNQFQIALLTLLGNVKSIPYNAAGNSLVQQALAAPIAAGLNFGAFAPGSISASEQQAVNAQAGLPISNVLQTQGWYLQILPASSSTRAARQSPPCTFWYLDRGSVQQINLGSVEVQ